MKEFFQKKSVAITITLVVIALAVVIGAVSAPKGAQTQSSASLSADASGWAKKNYAQYEDIVGAVGIVIADSMWGEITPRMAQAVGQSDARRVLIPINLCSNLVVGVSEMSMSKLVQAAVDTVRRLTEKK